MLFVTYSRYRLTNTGYVKIRDAPDNLFSDIFRDSLLWNLYCDIVLEDRRLKEQNKKESIFE